ncbi:MAG: DNA topoisomerase IB, partial [Alphaproteobacteria bacterium]|nr:DNA topoisomerase IB [Alphaproteobacteria bacterium]
MESDLDHPAAARQAGLTHIRDDAPGIRREPTGSGFDYTWPDGRQVRDEDTLSRIRALAVPPAWIEVWIAPDPLGHLQATGRDARGRKQYRYHPRWRAVRDESKFGRMLAFGEALPRLRQRIDADLRRRGLPRERVVAAVVRLLERGLIRVGNTEYARDNHSYGATTLRDEHVEIDNATLSFEFRAKSGKTQTLRLRDP